MSNHLKCITITHWFPIITRCPLSIWPDFVFVEVDYILTPMDDFFPEIYHIRKTIRKTIQWKKAYMEDLALLLAETKELGNRATAIRVRFPFNRHIVEITSSHPQRNRKTKDDIQGI